MASQKELNQAFRIASEQPLPVFLYPARTRDERAWMKGLKDEKKIRSLGPRLYTSLPLKGIERAVRSNWSEISFPSLPKLDPQPSQCSRILSYS